MPASRPVIGLCLLALAAGPACAQNKGPDADVLKAGVMQVLSLATFGMISMSDQGVAVTQEGQDYRMRLPLSGFATPADAAITAVARPLGGGKVGIESMAFPSSGAIEVPLASGLANRIEFSVGRQTISGTVDPTLAAESTYTADFGDVRIATAQGEQHGEQTIDHVATDGTFSTGGDGRLTFVAQSRGTGLHMIGHGPNGFTSDTSARALAGHFSVEGLDRTQGARMLTAFRGLAAAGAQARAQRAELPPGQPNPGLSAEQRRDLGAVAAAADGLLNRLEVDETMEEVHFSVGTATGNAAGTIGSLRLAVTGDSAQDRLNTRLGITLDGIAVPAMAVQAGGLIPHHVDLKTVLAGVPVERLKALLREAAQDHTDPALLQAQARSLLGDPQARVGIETLAFDAGPLSVTGSAKLLPRPNGQLGGEIHIAARGVDALLAQVQSQPKLQQAMPLIFMAKGMARAQGDSLVWDIVLGDGAPTINGTPFGQPAGPGKTR
jgi:hypothetical protein